MTILFPNPPESSTARLPPVLSPYAPLRHSPSLSLSSTWASCPSLSLSLSLSPFLPFSLFLRPVRSVSRVCPFFLPLPPAPLCQFSLSLSLSLSLSVSVSVSLPFPPLSARTYTTASLSLSLSLSLSRSLASLSLSPSVSRNVGQTDRDGRRETMREGR